MQVAMIGRCMPGAVPAGWPVTLVVQRYNIHHQHVAAFGIQSCYLNTYGGKHSPEKFKANKLNLWNKLL